MKHILAVEDGGKCSRTGVIVNEAGDQLILTEDMRGNRVIISDDGYHGTLDTSEVLTPQLNVLDHMECTSLQAGGVEITESHSALFQQRLGVGVDAGDCVYGNQDRQLNHTVFNQIDEAYLEDDTIHLPSGLYFIRALAPVFSCGGNRLYVADFYGGTEALVFMGFSMYTTNNGYNNAIAQGLVQESRELKLKVRHQFLSGTSSGYGLGRGVPFGEYGTFTQVVVTKLV